MKIEEEDKQNKNLGKDRRIRWNTLWNINCLLRKTEIWQWL